VVVYTDGIKPMEDSKMASKIKFTVIRDYDGEVQAYQLGKWFLCKIYSWGNLVNWYIFDHLEIALFDCEKTKLGYIGDGNKEGYVLNCREGKRILIERYNEEV
jgi:hypothetical protein